MNAKIIVSALVVTVLSSQAYALKSSSTTPNNPSATTGTGASRAAVISQSPLLRQLQANGMMSELSPEMVAHLNEISANNNNETVKKISELIINDRGATQEDSAVQLALLLGFRNVVANPADQASVLAADLPSTVSEEIENFPRTIQQNGRAVANPALVKARLFQRSVLQKVRRGMDPVAAVQASARELGLSIQQINAMCKR